MQLHCGKCLKMNGKLGTVIFLISMLFQSFTSSSLPYKKVESASSAFGFRWGFTAVWVLRQMLLWILQLDDKSELIPVDSKLSWTLEPLFALYRLQYPKAHKHTTGKRHRSRKEMLWGVGGLSGSVNCHP